MIVEELIECLKKLDPKLPVCNETPCDISEILGVELHDGKDNDIETGYENDIYCDKDNKECKGNFYLVI